MGVPDCCCAPKSLRLCVEMRFLITECTPVPRTGKPRRRRAFSPPPNSPHAIAESPWHRNCFIIRRFYSQLRFLPGFPSLRILQHPLSRCHVLPGRRRRSTEGCAARLRTHSLPPDIPGPNQLLLLILPPQNTWKSSTPERGNRS